MQSWNDVDDAKVDVADDGDHSNTLWLLSYAHIDITSLVEVHFTTTTTITTILLFTLLL